MRTTSAPMRSAGLFLALSGVLHLVAPVFAGFAPGSLVLLAIGVIYLLLAAGINRGWRGLAYIVFVVLLVGANVAFAMVGGGLLPDYLWYAIIAADLVALVSLFVALWRGRRAVARP